MDIEKGILWSSVLAGGIISLIMAALFNLLGLGAGLIIVPPRWEAAKTIGMAAIIWFSIGGVVSMFLGGWVSSKTAEVVSNIKAAIYGLLSAGTAILTMLVMMTTTVGVITSGVTNMLSNSIKAVASNSDVLAKGVREIGFSVENTEKDSFPKTDQALASVLNKAKDSLESLKKESTKNPEEIQNKLKEILQEFLLNKNENDNQSIRRKLVEFLHENANMDESQAEKTVNDWQQQYVYLKEKAENKVKEATEKATNTLGAIALLSFFVILLSFSAGAVGGLVGRKNLNM